MLKMKMHTNHSSPFHVHVERPTLSQEDVEKLIDAKIQMLANVARTGLIGDLEQEWDNEIILNCGTMDISLAKLDKTILD